MIFPISGPWRRLIRGLSAASVAGASAIALHAQSAPARPESESLGAAAPLDVHRLRDLRAGGQTELAQALGTQNAAINAPHTSQSDGTDHLQLLTLRGLAPDQLVVLVNGQRWHPSALVNVNNSVGRGSVSTHLAAIPFTAIERVEVLRDSAAARYGDGAIAGVVNIVLRADLDRGFEATWGATSDGDGEVREASVSGGFSLGPTGSFLRATAWSRQRNGTDRSANDTRQQYFATDLATGVPLEISSAYLSGLTPAPGTKFDAREAGYNRHNHWIGDADWRDQSLLLNGAYPLGHGAELYAFANYATRDGKAAGYVRRAGEDRTVRTLWPDGFLPKINTDIEDWSFGGGLRGKLGAWAYDASLTHGTNRLDYTVTDGNNVSLGAASPRRFDAGGLRHDETGVNLELKRVIDLGLEHKLEVSAGADYRWLTYRIRAGEPDSYRTGPASILDGPDAGADALSAAQVLPGFQPGDAQRHGREQTGVHVSLDQAINKNLLVQLQSRYDDSAEFGEQVESRAFVRVAGLGPWGAHASAGTAHRLPSLPQLWYSATANNFIGGFAFRNRTLPNSTAVAQALGARPLTPEDSVSYTAGLSFAPAPDFSASLDFYRLDVDDRVTLSSNFIGSAIATLLERQGFQGVAGGRYFANALDSRSDGYRAAASYRHKFADDSRVTLDATYHFERQTARRVAPAPAQLAVLGVTTPLLDLTERTRLLSSQPKDTVNFTLTYAWRAFSARLATTRYGEVEAVALTNATPEQIAAVVGGYRVRLSPVAENVVTGGGSDALNAGLAANPNRQVTQIFDAKWITDLEFGYDFNARLRLEIGAQNLFDIYPTRNLPTVISGGKAINGSDFFGIAPYNPISPFGFNGAYYYTRLALKF